MMKTIEWIRARIPENRKRPWNLLEKPMYGQVNGIPGSRGQMVATDGVRCVVLQENDTYFIGHRAWFVAVETGTEKETEKPSKTSRRQRREYR